MTPPRIYRKKRNGKPYGNWIGLLKSDAGWRHVNLGTKELEEAKSRARSRLEEMGKPVAKAPSPTENAAPKETQPPPAPPPSPAETDSGNGARAILNDWAKGTLAGGAPSSTLPHTPARTQTDTKIVKGLALACSRLNVAAVGATVKVFGREPAEVEDDESDLLEAGWQLQWEEWLVHHPPQPWMLILAGTAGLGFAMYADGKPLPPEEKKKLEEGKAA